MARTGGAPHHHAAAADAAMKGAREATLSASVDAVGESFEPPPVVSIRGRLVRTTIVFGLLAVVVCLTAPLVGTTHISLIRVFDRSIPFADNVDAQIFFI